MAERKKNRKLAKSERKSQLANGNDANEFAISKSKNKHARGGAELSQTDKLQQQQLELMFSGNDEEKSREYDMRSIVREEKDRLKSEGKKR